MKYFLYALTVLFVGLKMTGYIDWDWWLVAWPLYLIFGWVGMAVVFKAVEKCK